METQDTIADALAMGVQIPADVVTFTEPNLSEELETTKRQLVEALNKVAQMTTRAADAERQRDNLEAAVRPLIDMVVNHVEQNLGDWVRDIVDERLDDRFEKYDPFDDYSFSRSFDERVADAVGNLSFEVSVR